MPIKSILEKMIQNRARKQQQDRAGEDGRRPGEPILFQVGQRWLLVVVVIFVTMVVVNGQRRKESVLCSTRHCGVQNWVLGMIFIDKLGKLGKPLILTANKKRLWLRP